MECANCGSTANDYYYDSDWCVTCVNTVLAEQAQEAKRMVEKPEVIDPLRIKAVRVRH